MFASICTNCKQNLKDFGQCGCFFSILSTFVVFGMFLKCLGMGLVMSYPGADSGGGGGVPGARPPLKLEKI